MRIEEDMKLDYKDVLIRPKRSTLGSRKEVDLERGFTFRNYKAEKENYRHWRGVPIIASNMDGVGTFEMADKLAEGKIMTCLVKTYSVKDLIDYFDTDMIERTEYVAMSIGITDSDANKFRGVYEHVGIKLKYVCIDVANGYSERFATFVRDFRQKYPNVVIIAGNVVTGEMTEELIPQEQTSKVLNRPGSFVRLHTNWGGHSNLVRSECADAAHGLGGHIIADGGCTCPGDVAKAFAGGADYVMLGGMLAGHDQGGGDIITKIYKTNEVDHEGVVVTEQKQFVQFYGMSSNAANKKHFGGLKEYRSSEGREVFVPYRGDVAATVQDLLGGIRSTCTYAGAIRLKHLMRCTTFVRCTQQFNGVYATNDK